MRKIILVVAGVDLRGKHPASPPHPPTPWGSLGQKFSPSLGTEEHRVCRDLGREGVKGE